VRAGSQRFSHASPSYPRANCFDFEPTSFSAGQLASPLHHVVKGKLGIPHNLAEDSFPQIAFAVDRDSRPAPVGMNEDGMASRLPVQGKATPLQDGNHLPGIERRKL